MPVGPQREVYPSFDEPLEHTHPFAQAQRLHGAGDLRRMFGGQRATTPWPRAAGIRGKPLYDKGLVAQALSQPRETVQMDPRALHSTQPGLIEPGVRYYMSEEYERTGRTYADRGNIANRTPVVYSERGGRNLILSGHHRAGAALLKGGQFEAIHVQEPS